MLMFFSLNVTKTLISFKIDKQFIVISFSCHSESFSEVTAVLFLKFIDILLNEILFQVKERLRPYVKDPYACDLLDKLLVLDPAKRYDSDSALNHDFFWTDPMPCDLSKMLAQHTQSMFEYLAPPRRQGHMRPHHHHPGPTGAAGPVAKSSASMDSGYQDRVF